MLEEEILDENCEAKVKEKKYFSLIYNLVYVLIQDGIAELEILEALCNFPELKNRILKQKINKKKENEENLAIQDQELQKLRKLMSLCIQFFKETVRGLENNDCLERMEAFTNDLIKEEKEEDNLLEKSKEMLQKIKKLEREIEIFKLEGYLLIKEKNEYIGKLKDKYEDSIREYQYKMDYMEKWEESRLHQKQLELEQKEFQEKDRLRDCRNKIARETRIHAEIEAYTEAVIDDYYNAIEFWKDKHKSDLNKVNKKIETLQKFRIKQNMKFVSLKALYQARVEEMNEYAVLKEKRRKEAEEKAYLNAQATKIQAWWRGQMVRHKLGPYKVKKPKKGKGKSGDKTAKK